MSQHTTATQRLAAGNGRNILNLGTKAIWHMPKPFGIARLLGQKYALRCVLFHDILSTESSFTHGLGVTVSPESFESSLKFITTHYNPVGLQEVIDAAGGSEMPPRPVLVSFDDAYASVVEVAAPLCVQYGVPAVFFVNAGCLDNRQIALDNLICYAANVYGMGLINAAAEAASGKEDDELNSLPEVFSRYLPLTSLSVRKVFRRALVELTGINEEGLASEAALYMTSQDLRSLKAFNIEVGNHTLSHPNCRSLAVEEFADEIDRNRAMLEQLSETKVRSFSVPYGCWSDLTDGLSAHLHRSGYEAVFLAEGRTNTSPANRSSLDRISVKANTDAGIFSEIEVLPRLRAIRDGLFSTRGPEQRNSLDQTIRRTATQDLRSGRATDIQAEHN